MENKRMRKASDSVKLDRSEIVVPTVTTIPVQQSPVANGSPFITAPHSQLSDKLVTLSRAKSKKNPTSINGGYMFLWNNQQLNIDAAIETIPVHAHKLLTEATSILIKNNPIGQKGKKVEPNNCIVYIPFKEYAKKCGYQIEPRITDSPKAADQEKKRAKSAKNNALSRIGNSLKVLSASLAFYPKETNGENSTVPTRINILTASGMNKSGGYIVMEFTPFAAKYFINHPLYRLPSAAMQLDERNPVAYKIIVKLAAHACIYNNIVRGTNNRISVGKLLAAVGAPLPTIKEVRETKHSWVERIKDPIEKALDQLAGMPDQKKTALKNTPKVLESWRYCGPNGTELPDDQVYFRSYEEWSKALIEFKMVNENDLLPPSTKRRRRTPTKKGKKEADPPKE